MTAALAVGAALAPLAVAVLGRSGALVAVGLLLPASGAVAWRWLRRLDEEALQPGPHLGLLRAVSFLRPAPPAVLESLSREVEEVAVADGAVVVREGEPGDRFYVLVSGEVAVTRGGVEVRRLGEPGDSFGEIALLHRVPRTATVRAVGEVLLVALARHDFLRLVGASAAGRDAADATAKRYLDDDERGAQPAGDT